MEVQVEEIKKILIAVKPGLAKRDIIEQATHFAFTGKEVITYNDSICISQPFETDFFCSVPASQLFKILDSLSSRNVVLQLNKKKKMEVKASGIRASVATQSGEEILDYVGKLELDDNKKYKLLPVDFVEGLTLCMFSASRDMTVPELTGVYIDNNVIMSTDDLRISRYELSGNVKKSFNIPASSVQELIKLPIGRFCVSDSWAYFKTKDGVVFCARLIAGDFPSVSGLFDFKGTKLTLPEKLSWAIDTAMIMGQGEVEVDKLISVRVEGKFIYCKGENELGWLEAKVKFDPSKKRDISFSINPNFFLKILSHTRSMKYGADRALFQTENFSHLLRLIADGE